MRSDVNHELVDRESNLRGEGKAGRDEGIAIQRSSLLVRASRKTRKIARNRARECSPPAILIARDSRAGSFRLSGSSSLRLRSDYRKSSGRHLRFRCGLDFARARSKTRRTAARFAAAFRDRSEQTRNADAERTQQPSPSPSRSTERSFL